MQPRRYFENKKTRIKSNDNGTVSLEELPNREIVLTCYGGDSVRRREGVRIAFESREGVMHLLQTHSVLMVIMLLLYLGSALAVSAFLVITGVDQLLPLVVLCYVFCLFPAVIMFDYIVKAILQRTWNPTF